MEMVHLTATDMTWQRFEVCNPNQKIAFENLCRAVFNQDFFGGTAHFHSNPNNPGLASSQSILPQQIMIK